MLASDWLDYTAPESWWSWFSSSALIENCFAIQPATIIGSYYRSGRTQLESNHLYRKLYEVKQTCPWGGKDHFFGQHYLCSKQGFKERILKSEHEINKSYCQIESPCCWIRTGKIPHTITACTQAGMDSTSAKPDDPCYPSTIWLFYKEHHAMLQWLAFSGFKYPTNINGLEVRWLGEVNNSKNSRVFGLQVVPVKVCLGPLSCCSINPSPQRRKPEYSTSLLGCKCPTPESAKNPNTWIFPPLFNVVLIHFGIILSPLHTPFCYYHESQTGIHQ